MILPQAPLKGDFQNPLNTPKAHKCDWGAQYVKGA